MLLNSKAEQEGFGWSKSHFRSHDTLCPVMALWEYAEHFPERFHGDPEAHLPITRWSNGSWVRREQVQKLLRAAAVAVGLPAERFMSHSLRVGGAPALYHVVNDIEIVKRWGRLTSQAFHRYLWDSAEQAKDFARGMAMDDAALHYG